MLGCVKFNNARGDAFSVCIVLTQLLFFIEQINVSQILHARNTHPFRRIKSQRFLNNLPHTRIHLRLNVLRNVTAIIPNVFEELFDI
jgi:hypothetical protein